MHSVFVADPSFDHKGLRIAAIPLGSGLVASYLKGRHPEIDVRVFKALSLLMDEIKKQPPDVLGLTNYLWNKNLCLAVAEYAKQLNPNMLVVFGGPEIDSDPHDLNNFVSKYQNVDLFVQHEGEVAFCQIVEKLLECGGDSKRVIESIGELGNSFFVDASGQIVKGPKLPRIEDLDEVPSPYLMGIFDHFLEDDQYMPMIQTNRGCPYTCTFCQEGDVYFSKFKRHSQEFVEQELDYIAQRVNPKSALWITDSNWAMYKWDEDVARHIASIQSRIGWPSEIIASTGKSNLDRIIRITEMLNHTMYISNSVQSMNEDVLKTIQRKNISATEMEKNREGLRGLRQEPEVICPLPKETKDTFFNGINSLLDSASNQRFAVFQTLILSNTELAHDSTIEEFDLSIKYKQHFNLMGWVNGNFVCETERVVESTESMTRDEYCDCRVYAMLIDAMVRFEPIHEIFRYLSSYTIPFSRLLQRLYDSIPHAPTVIQACVEDFKRDLLEEMHDSERAVIDYMKANETEYENGQRGGGNLRYSNMLWIDHPAATLEWIFDSLKAVSDQSIEVANEIGALRDYLLSVYSDRIHSGDSEKEISASFGFHVKYWSETKAVQPMSEFKGATDYSFLKTQISGIDGLSVWQNFGFKLDQGTKQDLPGYTNRLFFSKLRRKVDTVRSEVRARDGDEIQEPWVAKLA